MFLKEFKTLYNLNMIEKLEYGVVCSLLEEANILVRLYSRAGYDPRTNFLNNGNYNHGVAALVAADQLQRQHGAVVTRVSYKKTSPEARVFLQGFIPEVGMSCQDQNVELIIPVDHKKRESALLVYALCIAAEANMRRYNSGSLNFNERDTNHAKQNLETHLVQ